MPCSDVISTTICEPRSAFAQMSGALRCLRLLVINFSIAAMVGVSASMRWLCPASSRSSPGK
jgi:hypothetical protein